MSAKFLETADRMGARICRDAIWAGGRCNWIGGYTESASAIVHRALTPDVYSGTSGIALALFELSEATGEKVFRMTAEGALRQALSREDELRAGRRFGFFDGLAGVAHVAAQVESHAAEALRIAHDMPADESRLDIINGSAGAIGGLLYLHRKTGESWLLERAVEHARTLVRHADRCEAGWRWNTMDGGTNALKGALTGFAHGAAGIGWALLEVFQATGEAEFREAALEAFRWENSHFDAEERNWPDYRFPAKPTGAVMWCHGAPGIGLARLRAWQILGEDRFRDEAEIAFGTTSRWLDATPEANYCLCHGQAGNAGLLLWGGKILGKAEYLAQARRVGERGIAQYEDERIPWPCGVPGGDETPDLMLGLAGIAWFYLRLARFQSSAQSGAQSGD